MKYWWNESTAKLRFAASEFLLAAKTALRASGFSSGSSRFSSDGQKEPDEVSGGTL